MPFHNEMSRHAFLETLKKEKIRYQQTDWQNYMQTVFTAEVILIQIKDEKEIIKVIKAINEENTKYLDSTITVRAVAGWQDTPSSSCCRMWSSVQEQQYNESFSFSPTGIADVIIQFSKSFHAIHIGTDFVQVTAGVQIHQLATTLLKHRLSLPTVSMIPWVSAVGLAGTGGHGTGKDQPAFSSLIRRLRLCDMDGEIRTLSREDKNFTRLTSAHAGNLGIILSIELDVVPAFNLQETMHYFDSVRSLKPQLAEFLLDNDYFTLMGTPIYGETSAVSWQTRLWNITHKPPTTLEPPAYGADVCSLINELSVQLGASIQDWLVKDKALQPLYPEFMQLVANMLKTSRGSETIIRPEAYTTHYQASFPKAMRDIGYIIPVKKEAAADVLSKILKQIDTLLDEASKRGEYPQTYAIYVRYLKCSGEGLSSMTEDGEKKQVLIIDMVSHPNAPGIGRFEQAFLEYLHQQNHRPRFHLGKNLPASMTNYHSFLDPIHLELYTEALVDFQHGRPLEKSPFFTPFIKNMVINSANKSPSAPHPIAPTTINFSRDRTRYRTIASINRAAYLTKATEMKQAQRQHIVEKLMALVGSHPLLNGNSSDRFLQHCQDTLATLSKREDKSKTMVVSVV